MKRNKVIFLIRKLWILPEKHNRYTIITETAISPEKQPIIMAARKGKEKYMINDKTKNERDFLDESAFTEDMDSFFKQEMEQREEDELINLDETEDTVEEVVSDDFYQRCVSSVTLLTKEEEIECGMAVKYGSPDEAEAAKKKLVEHNMRYVLSIANRYTASGVSYDDIVQEGFIGLMKAADKFDPELGYRFTTYATWWIKQSIQRSIMDHGRSVRLPVHVMEKIHTLKKAEREALQLPQRDSMEVLMEKTGFSKRQILLLQELSQDAVSLDTPIGEEQDSTLGDFVAAESRTTEDVVMEQCLSSDLQEVMKACLSPKEHDIITRRFGLDGSQPQTLEEVGALYGVTRERIRQIETKALRKLKHPQRLAKLKGYISTT